MDASSRRDLDLFISYKSDDVHLVRRIMERLMAEGLAVWMNEYGVPYQEYDNFQEHINKAIDSSKRGLLFVNDSFAGSPYCHVEIERLLRRLPRERITVIILSQSRTFARLYPKLEAQGHQTGYSEGGIYQALLQSGTLTDAISPVELETDPADSSPFIIKEAGIRFEASGWNIVGASRFFGIIQREKLSYSGQPRVEFERLERQLYGHRVTLLLDYELYDEQRCETVMDRLEAVNYEPARIMDLEKDERQRLKDELQRYPQEVAAVQQMIRRRFDDFSFLPDSSMPEESPYIPLGVHIYFKKDRGQLFAHRLFSFAVPELASIFRVYKLVLPHPQYQRPFRIRFIFRLSDDREKFLRATPWCDHLVDSFDWLTVKSVEVKDILEQTQNLFGRKHK